MCFATRHGTPGRFGATRRIRPSGQVVDVVEARHVDATGGGEAHEHLVAAARAALALPLADQLADREHDLLAVAEHGCVEEVRDRLRVERGVPAGDHDRVRLVAVDRVQRDASQVEAGQEVRVAELGRERDAEQVERADRAVRVDREVRHVVLAHERLEIGPHGVRRARRGSRAAR